MSIGWELVQRLFEKKQMPKEKRVAWSNGLEGKSALEEEVFEVGGKHAYQAFSLPFPY